MDEPSFLSDKTSCKADETSYLLVTVNMALEGYDRIERYDLSCRNNSLPDLSTAAGITDFVLAAQNNGQSTADEPGWHFMVGFPGKPDATQDIYKYTQTIEKDILSGTDLDRARAHLDALIRYIPYDDIDGAALIHELQYWTGLSYEIEGKSEDAVSAYLELIKNAPDSAWSWLAWARLAPSPTQ
jgi:tetratricopeptide (TPR) repeat protein